MPENMSGGEFSVPAFLIPPRFLNATVESARSSSDLHTPVRSAVVSNTFFTYIQKLVRCCKPEEALSPQLVASSFVAGGEVMVEAGVVAYEHYAKTNLMLSVYAADEAALHTATLTGWTHLAGQLTTNIDKANVDGRRLSSEKPSITAEATIGQLALGCNYAQQFLSAVRPQYATEALRLALTAEESAAILWGMGLPIHSVIEQ